MRTLDIPETGLFHGKRVRTGVQILKGVDTRRIRDRVLDHSGIFISKSDRRLRDNGARIVGDPTSYASAVSLRKKKHWENNGRNNQQT
jgi:hypothetical protein